MRKQISRATATLLALLLATPSTTGIAQQRRQQAPPPPAYRAPPPPAVHRPPPPQQNRRPYVAPAQPYVQPGPNRQPSQQNPGLRHANPTGPNPGTRPTGPVGPRLGGVPSRITSPHGAHGPNRVTSYHRVGRSNWPYYAAASFVAGAVILGAGYYYFFDSGPDEVVLLPYGDDDFYDREDFVRNLNEDGTIPSNFTMHDPPTYSSELWAAVSISTDGAYSGSWDYESAEAAAEDVTRRCRAASRDPERCNTAVSTGWVQGVRCFRQNADGTWNSRAAVGSGATAPEAMSDAFQSALRDGRFHISECKDRIAIGAHGEHRKYKE